MSDRSAPSYSLPARCLHWAVALATLAMIWIGWWMVRLDYYHTWYYASRQWHEALGVAVWLAGLAFAFGNVINRPPAILTVKRWETIAALLTHKLLYAAVLILPVAGYLIQTADGAPLSLFDVPVLPAIAKLDAESREVVETVHAIGAYGLLGLVVIHAAGAIKHHLVDRDRTLMRMLRGR